MIPKRVVFAANAVPSSGAGHLRRLVEVAREMPASIDKVLFGSVEISWMQELANETFCLVSSCDEPIKSDLIIIDSYDSSFCLLASSKFPTKLKIQVADRYTSLLSDANYIFMDLPFEYHSKDVESRTLGHGIHYLPKRIFGSHINLFHEQAREVLITTGGVANKEILSLLVSELTKEIYQEINFHFIVEDDFFQETRENFVFHKFGSKFDLIAGCCDTVISAAGTTTWDLLANRKIVGLVATIHNQLANFSFVVNSNLALPLFSIETQRFDVENLRTLLFDKARRQSLFSSTLGKFDFLGAKRTSDTILSKYARDNLRP